MPWLAAVYGLRWCDIESMPFGELAEYRQRIDDIVQAMRGGR